MKILPMNVKSDVVLSITIITTNTGYYSGHPTIPDEGGSQKAALSGNWNGGRWGVQTSINRVAKELAWFFCEQN